MEHPVARRALAAALLIAVALAPRGSAASTVITGGSLGTQTWTSTGSPYIVEGDITVPAGASLVIEGGADVQFAGGDTQAAGVDTTRTELTVSGTLLVTGTTGNPVTFEMQPGQSGTWYGLVIAANATAASITGASFAGFSAAAITSSMTGATLLVRSTTIRGNVNGGINVGIGTANLESLNIMPATGAGPMTYGLELGTRSATTTYVINVTNALMADCQYGIYVGSGNVTAKIWSSTIDHGAYGIYVEGAKPMVTVENTIVTRSAITGVTATVPGSTAVNYSDIWGAPTASSGGGLEAGILAADPRYVGSGNSFYHLQAGSACIDTGGNASGAFAFDHDLDGTLRPLDGDGVNGAAYDMGAYEYDPGAGAGGAGGAGGGGTAGSSGIAGTSGGGAAGATGAAGTGAAGNSGAAGAAGASGGGGAAGVSGAAGASGGAAGNGGAAGASGIGGVAGGASGGAAGATGAAGAAGAAGTTGAAGAAGAMAGAGGAAGGSGGGGCGCQTGGRPASAWGAVLIGAALLLGRRRRSRRFYW